MSEDQVPVYVRMAADQAARLEAAASVSGRSKRRLVEDAVRQHLTDQGLVVGRASLREPAPEVLTLEEAAALLRVETDELRAAADRRELPGRRIGDQWRFSHAALIDWLAGNRAASND